ncbi:hypothetical protein QQF64_033738 [Cirrhinus molitorella]|uniref:Uncharacterized protein n=1 Tax=Cirrhinus molitorella TaxID=172907 RepID=A0ABR3MV10_9TELE
MATTPHISCLAIKREFSFQDLRGAAEALKMSLKLDMNQLYDAFCVLLPHVKEITATTNPIPKHDSFGIFGFEHSRDQHIRGKGVFSDDGCVDRDKEPQNCGPHKR